MSGIVRLDDPRLREFWSERHLCTLTTLRADGSRIGVVHGVDNFGAGDLIEGVADDGRRLSLPFTRRTVPSIDLARRSLVVEPPDELMAETAP